PLTPPVFGPAVEKTVATHLKSRLTYIMASEGSRNRFDLLFTNDAGRTDVVRVDGDGTILRERPQNYDYPAPGLFQMALDFHETLFSGDRGKWFMGLSGALLFSNLLFGLVLAWRTRTQTWRRVLLPGVAGKLTANIYKWHRALGLMLVFPAMGLVALGVLQEWPADQWLGIHAPTPTAHATMQTHLVPLGAALDTALAHYPTAALSLVAMPSANEPWYRIRLRQPGELARVYGATTLFVDVHDGAVLLDRDAFKLPLNEKIYNAIYPIHTGDFAGPLGRTFVLAFGLWLITQAVLGLWLWRTRRERRKLNISQHQ
ncbi:MAG: PepSY-associated TM helix domain-containing protein, partial [Rhodanobacter sp.]